MIFLLFFISLITCDAYAKLTLIYVKSSNMPLSTGPGETLIQQLEKISNYKVLRAQEEEYPQLIHYPALILKRNGVVNNIIYGVQTPKTYIDAINLSQRKVNNSLLRYEVANTLPISEIKIDKKVKYFFRPLPNTQAYSISMRLSNYIVSSDHKGKINIDRIQGTVDAVPSPDGKLMTIPNYLPITGGMRFYKISKKKESFHLKKILKDRNLTGAYQSIGILAENHYRVFTQSFLNKKTGFFYKDYKLKGSQLRPTTRKRRRICRGENLVLPMISKDGSMLAGYDYESRHTKIYSFSKTGQCSLVYDFDFPTGKIDFSYDGKWVAFHFSENNPEKVTSVYASPSERKMGTLKVYVRNLETGKNYLIDSCDDADFCYFPSFHPDGSLSYYKRTDDKKKSVSIKRVFFAP